jgi:hypothetical protein
MVSGSASGLVCNAGRTPKVTLTLTVSVDSWGFPAGHGTPASSMVGGGWPDEVDRGHTAEGERRVCTWVNYLGSRGQVHTEVAAVLDRAVGISDE